MQFAVLNPDAERREGLKALLRQIDRRAQFHDAPDWPSAERAMPRFAPHLFVVDWHDGIRAGELHTFSAKYPALPVAVLTDDASPPTVRGLLTEGARGVIPRTADARLIVKVFEIVLLGGNHVPADALHPFAASTRQRRGTGAAGTLGMPGSHLAACRSRIAENLSPRQEQIMRCVHMGSTNKMIARALGISEGTVKIHLASIFQQLGAPNRAAAVAIYNGWLASQLQVLQTHDECAPRPVHGQPGPIPLRQRDNPSWRYPLPSDSAPDTLPLAAEPTLPFGEVSRASAQQIDDA